MGLYVCVWECVVVCLKLEIILFGGVAWFSLYCGCTKPASMHLCWMPHPKACHTVSSLSVYDLTVLFCFCSPLCPILSLTFLLFLFPPTFFSASNSPMFSFSLSLYTPHPTHIHFLSLLWLNFQLYPLYTSSHLRILNSPCFNSLVTSSFLRLYPFDPLHFISLSLSSSSLFCLLSEGTVKAPVEHLAVVKAAQTVTWSAWSHGPGAAPIQTAPTAPSGRPSLRLAASLASPSLPEGIASAATKAHREAAKALALVRTLEESW